MKDEKNNKASITNQTSESNFDISTKFCDGMTIFLYISGKESKPSYYRDRGMNNIPHDACHEKGLYTAFYNAISVNLFMSVHFLLTYLVFYHCTSCIYKASTEEWR